ncbi:G-protein coupled receptor family C group 6 member A [Acipenser oxyrinchus oxyrinchus]|uniref:G-protein coupled receptor family C group 6 member A n=1 Tax=Acipenser oxyrinchus oxyrinchus TaxID=40147 RepID=A0AAD8LNZ5_ACIOX|nr:G-protein coupled receptor family C group 6 member A [Acipenser oxyrinchus oxyrinchus]
MGSCWVLCICFALFLSRAESCQNPGDLIKASSPGDIIIGGLFSIHTNVKYSHLPRRPEALVCEGFNTVGLIRMISMIHAIEEINNSTLLNGIKLGYDIYDTCSDVTTAVQATMELITNSSESCAEPHCKNTVVVPKVKAVVGCEYSEISIAVARVLNIQLIPQISYASSAEMLSDQRRFPAFLRSIPSDKHQTKAMVKLVNMSGWNWIGTIAIDDIYGRSAIELFISQSAPMGICVDFKEFIPPVISDTIMNNIIELIRKEERVKVIVAFASPSFMKKLFQAFEGEILDKIWIASDSWSTSSEVSALPNLNNVGKVIGFTFQSENPTSFYEYLKNVKINVENIFLKEYGARVSGCSHHTGDFDSCVSNYTLDLCSLLEKKQETQDTKEEFLLRNIRPYPAIIFNTQLAVQAIAQGIHDLCKDGKCHNPKVISPWEKVISNCSDSCAKGQFRKTAGGQHTCCFECLNCTGNHYSDPMDMYQCLPCDHHTEWSLPGDAECSKKELEYFMLSDFFAIALLSFAAIGVALVCVIVVIFIRYRETPVVKASGGAICYLILLCLFCNFVCSVFFVGEPRNIICQVRQVLYGLSFACCVSCILVKSFKILLAFNFNPYVQAVLRKLYRPVAIIIGSTGIQVLICTLWLILNRPHEERVPSERTILLQCNEGSYVAFGVMLGYIALLAVVCFVCAFKIRKLPENYNEAKFITFGMLVYFISWVIFVPIYVTSTGKYIQAIQLVVILISSYGILICQFFPKCYVILFKKEHNTKDAFLKNVYEYSAKTANNIVLPNGLPPDSKPTAKEEDSAFYKTNPGFLADETSVQVRANYIQRESFRRILDNTFPRKRVASV